MGVNVRVRGIIFLHLIICSDFVRASLSAENSEYLKSDKSISRYVVISSGIDYNIFFVKRSVNHQALIAAPEIWISYMLNNYELLDKIVGNTTTAVVRAREAYIEVVKSYVSANIFGSAEMSVVPALGTNYFTAVPLDVKSRVGGKDWTYLGLTMTGHARVKNVQDLLVDIIKKNISGGYMETGVWRGGSSIFARAVMRAYGEGNRKLFVCDSFAGLPPGERQLDSRDKGWDKTSYLEVGVDTVVDNFRRLSLLDHNVIFAQGFFNLSMPRLRYHVDQLAILRMDGDMYESTVDVLYHMYDKLELNGYVIVDDWIQNHGEDFPSKTAVEDFWAVHGLKPNIFEIDGCSVYWKKTVNVEIQYWRYKQSKFKVEDKNSSAV